MNRINNQLIFKIIIVPSLFVLIIGALLVPPALAQEQKREEKFIVTWKSAALAPSFYQGKILPTKYGALKINFELIADGRPVNLKNQEIQWFINHELKARGRGLRSLNLSPDALANRDALVRIVVKNFRGRDLEEILTIPVARPETVIERLSDNFFRTWPFFFSALADNLIFSWEVNGQTSLGRAAEPSLLELTMIGETAGAVAVQAVVQNQTNPLETAKGVLMVGARGDL